MLQDAKQIDKFFSVNVQNVAGSQLKLWHIPGTVDEKVDGGLVLYWFLSVTRRRASERDRFDNVKLHARCSRTNNPTYSGAPSKAGRIVILATVTNAHYFFHRRAHGERRDI